MNASPDESSAPAWVAIHASALVVGEAGIVIRGPSGSGKSALTLALLALAGDRGLFAALIGDDRVLIAARHRRLLARGAPGVIGQIERRGFGIVAAPTEPCAVVRVVVDLLAGTDRVPRLPDASEFTTALGGVALARLTFDAGIGALERAYAILGHVDSASNRNMTGIAHFA
jgi:hypothetical protein